MLKNRVFSFALILLTLALLGSCSTDPAEIGIGIQPENERLNVHFSDTSTVLAHSIFVDSITTDEPARSLLGSYYDPIFGVTTASIYTQLRLSSTSVDFGQNPQLDSIVLALQYTGIPGSDDEMFYSYGDTSDMLTFRVYELADSLSYEESYFSDDEIPLKQPEIGMLTTSPSPTDSIMVDTTLVKAQLRIPLTEEFAYRILNATEAELGSMEAFMQFIKGIHITVDPVSTGGSIVFFDLEQTLSRLSIYFSNEESDSLVYFFNITSESAHFLNYTHNYEVADPDFLAQVNGDTALGANRFYLQSMAGVASEITFPYFRDWHNNGKIALNEATLSIQNALPQTDFAPPPELVVYMITDDGTYKYLDDQYEGESYFGGNYNQETGEYQFRITQYLQKVLTSDTLSRKLYLGISGSSITPNRGIFFGYNPTSQADFAQRLKLNLIYTNLAETN
ncbi:MAG: DUF4270 domain-containing protein [Bacteroidales bacterium]